MMFVRDQVDFDTWRSNAAIRDRMQARGFQDTHALLVGFHNALHSFLRDQGRESVSWDPLVAPELDPGIVVQSVRGQAWVARAIRGGHRAVGSSQYYLDAMLPASHQGADLGILGFPQFLSADKFVNYAWYLSTNL